MLPAQRNKIDISVCFMLQCTLTRTTHTFVQKLTEEEQKLFRLYGKLPTHKNNLMKMQRVRCHI
jgi:hypothetical protein